LLLRAAARQLPVKRAKVELSQPYMKAICRAFHASKSCPKARPALFRLLQHFGKHRLADIQRVIPQYGHHDHNTLISGLLALARHADQWLRPPEDWRPDTQNFRRRFASLARHLFARWAVPPCMDAVWFKGISPHARRQQGWFLHVGQGQNLRTADLPLPFTKKMAHQFMQAPPEYPIEAALRWGQILGLGGNARLVRTVLSTRLGTVFEHEEFWTGVLQFFVTHPPDRAQVGPIIDYLHHEKFVPQEVLVAPGVVQRQPRQPHLTLKGRTLASLLREVDAWHRMLAAADFPSVEWPASGIEGLALVEETGSGPKIWTITELCTTKALVEEGRVMRNCVASYARSCAHGGCSIWTLEVETAQRRWKLLTIEVQPATRQIVQAKAECNAPPCEKHRKFLRKWAKEARLEVAEWV
jgi:PcfJ-like protein